MPNLGNFFSNVFAGLDRNQVGALISRASDAISQTALTQAKADLHAGIHAELMPRINKLRDEALRTGKYDKLLEDTHTATQQYFDDYRAQRGDVFDRNALNKYEADNKNRIAADTFSFIETKVKDQQIATIEQSMENSLKAVRQDPSTLDMHLANINDLEADVTVAAGSPSKARKYVSAQRDALIQSAAINAANSSPESGQAILDAHKNDLDSKSVSRIQKQIDNTFKARKKINTAIFDRGQKIESVLESLSEEVYLDPSANNKKNMSLFYSAWKNGELEGDPRVSNLSVEDIITKTGIMPSEYLNDQRSLINSNDPAKAVPAAESIGQLGATTPQVFSQVSHTKTVRDDAHYLNTLIKAGISPQEALTSLTESRKVSDQQRKFNLQQFNKKSGQDSLTEELEDKFQTPEELPLGLAYSNDFRNREVKIPDELWAEASNLGSELAGHSTKPMGSIAESTVNILSSDWKQGTFLNKTEIAKNHISMHHPDALKVVAPKDSKYKYLEPTYRSSALLETVTRAASIIPGSDLIRKLPDMRERLVDHFTVEFIEDISQAQIANYAFDPGDVDKLSLEYSGIDEQGTRIYHVLYDGDLGIEKLMTRNSEEELAFVEWTPSSNKEFKKRFPFIKVYEE